MQSYHQVQWVLEIDMSNSHYLSPETRAFLNAYGIGATSPGSHGPVYLLPVSNAMSDGNLRILFKYAQDNSGVELKMPFYGALLNQPDNYGRSLLQYADNWPANLTLPVRIERQIQAAKGIVGDNDQIKHIGVFAGALPYQHRTASAKRLYIDKIREAVSRLTSGLTRIGSVRVSTYDFEALRAVSMVPHIRKDQIIPIERMPAQMNKKSDQGQLSFERTQLVRRYETLRDCTHAIIFTQDPAQGDDAAFIHYASNVLSGAMVRHILVPDAYFEGMARPSPQTNQALEVLDALKAKHRAARSPSEAQHHEGLEEGLLELKERYPDFIPCNLTPEGALSGQNITEGALREGNIPLLAYIVLSHEANRINPSAGFINKLALMVQSPDFSENAGLDVIDQILTPLIAKAPWANDRFLAIIERNPTIVESGLRLGNMADEIAIPLLSDLLTGFGDKNQEGDPRFSESLRSGFLKGELKAINRHVADTFVEANISPIPLDVKRAIIHRYPVSISSLYRCLDDDINLEAGEAILNCADRLTCAELSWLARQLRNDLDRERIESIGLWQQLSERIPHYTAEIQDKFSRSLTAEASLPMCLDMLNATVTQANSDPMNEGIQMLLDYTQTLALSEGSAKALLECARYEGASIELLQERAADCDDYTPEIAQAFEVINDQICKSSHLPVRSSKGQSIIL